MGWRIRQKLVLCVILALSLAFTIEFYFVANVNAVSITTITPHSGKVYDRVTVSGNVVPYVNWNVSFDINADGAFAFNERVTYGTAGGDPSINTYFIVPPCAGSDSGVNHTVQLISNYQYEGPNYLFVQAATPYDPPYVDTGTFTVYTDRIFSTVTSVQAGVSIPIRLTITGGMSNVAYNYSVQVTKPDASSSAATFSTKTDILGLANAAINYPGSFPPGQNTNQVGNYTILFSELAPNASVKSSNIVHVYSSTPPYSPPNATINSIQPNPATVGSTITFNGSGTASSGYSIINYNWTSNISGPLTSDSHFATSILPEGNHTITFLVQDNKYTWSAPVQMILRVTSNGTIPPEPPHSQPPDNSTTPTNPSDSNPSNGSSGSGSSDFSSSNSSSNSKPISGNPDRPNENSNASNQAPTARLNTTPPTAITKGQSIILVGEGFDADGTVVGYQWSSNISGLISTSSQLDTASLAEGTHLLTFQVTDNNNAPSEPLSIVLTVALPFQPLPYYVAGGAAVTVTVGIGAAIWGHYNNLTSPKIKAKVAQKNAQEQNKQEKRQKKKDKKQPNLIFAASNFPQSIMGQAAYEAQFTVKNVGSAKATNVEIDGLANPFVEYQQKTAQIPSLAPEETQKVTFPFSTKADIRKNIYQLQFELLSSQTKPKTKRCFMRGGRIAVLTDAGSPDTAKPLLQWLKDNRYPHQEIHDAAHLLPQLYQYDLIIVAAKQEMPAKWVKNLCTYAENGQSILLLDNISTTSPQHLNETLGYSVEPATVFFEQANLVACKQHPITNGLVLGEQIPLGSCIGNTCKFGEATSTTAVVACSISQSSNVDAVAALLVKETGKGKIVHLNFQAQEHLGKLGRLVKNAIEWLLWD